jgi:hypothetical protein
MPQYFPDPRVLALCLERIIPLLMKVLLTEVYDDREAI